MVKTADCLVVSLLLALSGCVPAFLADPDINQRVSQIKTVAILPPHVDVFELKVDGTREKMDAWSDTGGKNVLAALESEVSKLKIKASTISLAPLSDEERLQFEETDALFGAVNDSIWHLFSPSAEERFPDKSLRDYTLGRDTEKLSVNGSDALLLVRGFDHISSEGRKALQVGMFLVAGGARTLYVPRMGVTHLVAALVDAHTGDILWYRFVNSEGVTDLRDAKSAAGLTERLLSEFPIR